VGCKDAGNVLPSMGSIGFYLNYVGCKGKNHGITCGAYSRFTLTMWDVKFIEIDTGYLSLNVLP